MGRPKKIKVSQDEAPTESAQAASGATQATVYKENGDLVRVYTLEQHGNDFQDRAAEMAAQFAGSRVEVF